MGLVKRVLAEVKLSEREPHNSRMFVDLCENIHIHYRELRIVFSLDEYFEFVDILQRSTQDVRNYLAQNPDYREGAYPTTVMVAGGKERQRKLLENSPAPNRSTYFANDFTIELQDESVVDEIHVHWRDYRMALPREHFRAIADAFAQAKRDLDAFEHEHGYQRRPHQDRTMEGFTRERAKYADYETRMGGEVVMPVDRIQTRFDDGEKSFSPPQRVIAELARLYAANEYVCPIVLSTERDGEHHVIDGNHRLHAAKQAGCSQINCVIADITFEQSADFRKAESLLKRFDRETAGVYRTGDFNRHYFAWHLNRHYANHFRSLRMYDHPLHPRAIGKRIKRARRALKGWLKGLLGIPAKHDKAVAK